MYLIVHELEPENMDIWLQRMDKTWYNFLVTSVCMLSRKYDELSELLAFGQKFAHQNGLKGGTT